jgi:hypothetical protein
VQHVSFSKWGGFFFQNILLSRCIDYGGCSEKKEASLNMRPFFIFFVQTLCSVLAEEVD